MARKIVVPNLGESIVEATVVQWYKKEGELVANGEKLVELETDKVNLDVGAEQGGILQKIEHPEGDDVKVGDVLGEISEKSEAAQESPPGAPQESADKPRSRPEQKKSSEQNGEAPLPAPAVKEDGDDKERVTPVARRMAQELGIDTAQVQPARPGARVTKQDVEQFVGQKQPPLEQVSKPVVEERKARPAAETPAQGDGRPEREERVLLSRRRRTIAQRLVEAQHSAAMLTTFNDVDMSAIVGIRKRHKDSFKEKYGVNLGIVSFFVKASINALREFPQVNAELRGDELILKHYYDIGVAIGAEEGLVVPVLRNADQLSFAEIENDIQEFVTKTRENTLTVEDLRGGTFTITNGGVYGSLLSTPILNAPQVAILGLHRIEERPVVVDGEVRIKSMMYLALSYDHRVIDGREAVQFLARIKKVIENPELLWLEG